MKSSKPKLPWLITLKSNKKLIVLVGCLIIFAVGLSVPTLQLQHSDSPLLVLQWSNPPLQADDDAPQQNQTRGEKVLQWVINTGQSLKDKAENGIQDGSNLVQSFIHHNSRPVPQDSGETPQNSGGT